MFALFFARRYLWPKKKQVSVSLIGILSVVVITTVVWLLLLFLSVTEGIEKTWLDKLTSLNAPVRITPTEYYYNSYYYQVDRIASRSEYSYKNIGEKLKASTSDPYLPDLDEELPVYMPISEKNEEGELLDPVKELYTLFDHLREKYPSLVAEDYEVAGALMRLKLLRENDSGALPQIHESFLSQASYISTLAKKSPYFLKLIQSPSPKDIKHLLFLANLKNAPSSSPDSLAAILENIDLKQIKFEKNKALIPKELLPENKAFVAYLFERNGIPISLHLSMEASFQEKEGCQKGHIKRNQDLLTFEKDGTCIDLSPSIPILPLEDFSLGVKKIESAPSLKEVKVTLLCLLQGQSIQSTIPWSDFTLQEVAAKTHFELSPSLPPPWVHFVNNTLVLPPSGILLPKNFRETGVCIGDKGDLSYQTTGLVGSREERIGSVVAGFYDPGVMAVGAKCLLASEETVREINSTSQNIALDPLMTNGIGLWFAPIKETRQIASDLESLMHDTNIHRYWQITPFYEYDFAKELMGQFQSDRYLFMLVGILILCVACSNIISLLLLLVKDKRHEIGVLLSLGARKRDIASIFGLSGLILGVVSSFLGIFLAYETLAHIDLFVQLLSKIEGQSAFSATFYGEHLPNQMSRTALIFILFVAPILSLIAGLLPAIKACSLKPSEILRGSE